MNRLIEAARQAGLTAALVSVWTAAIIVALLVMVNARQTFAALHEKQELAALTGVAHGKLDVAPIGNGEYQMAANRLKTLHPGLEIAAREGSLVISAKELSQYEQWRFGINDALNVLPGAKWRVKSVCLGESCTPGRFTIQLVASRESFVVNQ